MVSDMRDDATGQITKRTLVRLPTPLFDEVRSLAELELRSINSQIICMLRRSLDDRRDHAQQRKEDGPRSGGPIVIVCENTNIGSNSQAGMIQGPSRFNRVRKFIGPFEGDAKTMTMGIAANEFRGVVLQASKTAPSSERRVRSTLPSRNISVDTFLIRRQAPVALFRDPARTTQ